MKRHYTIPNKPYVSGEAEKRSAPRPRLGLRYGMSHDPAGEGLAKA